MNDEMNTDLSDIQIRLHDQEGIGGIRTGCLWIIEKLSHFRKSGLPETGTSGPLVSAIECRAATSSDCD